MNILKSTFSAALRAIAAIALLLPAIAQGATTTSSELLDRQYIAAATRADSAINARDWALAERLLVEAMDIKPGDPSNVLLMSNLGVVRQQLGNYNGAIDALTAANVLAPASVTVLSNRARLYISMGEKDKAVKDFNRVIELDSTLVEPYFYRGMIAFSRGDIVTADQDFAKLKRIAPDNDYTLIANATVATATGRNSDAVDLYKRLIDRDPASEYYAALVENYIALGDLTNASETIGEALHLYPADPDLYLARAVLNKRRYMIDEAKADAKRAVQLGADPDIVNAALNAQ